MVARSLAENPVNFILLTNSFIVSFSKLLLLWQIYNSVPFQKSYSRVQKNFATSLHGARQILLQIAALFTVQKLARFRGTM